jgi:endonuclease G, mitochondrial
MKKRLLTGAFLFALSLNADNTFIHQFFNDKVCDQVLNNDGYFKTCYDYKLKSAKYVAYTIDGSLVNKKNIKERPRFYEDLNIPKQYRSNYKDYTGSGYDRGHNFPDADADYSQRSLRSSYVLSQISPQEPSLNRSKKAWAGLERYERVIALKLGEVDVLDGIVFSNKPKRIGHNQIAVPSAFWKMIYSKKNNYQRCFYFDNKPIDETKSIKDYEVDCNKLF